MRCPSCGHKNPAGLVNCNVCSAPLPTKSIQLQAAKRKKRVRIIAATAAVIILLTCLAFFPKIEKAAAAGFIHSGNFDTPVFLWQNSRSGSLRDMAAYAALRNDINSQYPELSARFPEDTLASWHKTAEELQKANRITDPDICLELNSLTDDLHYIQQIDRTYTTLRGTVLDLMDVFTEYNRLHLGDETGNVSFTPREELNQLALWQADLDRLNQFAVTVNGYENVYLFSYMLKEAQGEITQLTSEINAIMDSGYSLDDTVRYSDRKARTFPAVHNQGSIQLNVAQKETYEAHMQAGLRSYLISSTLIHYYSH